jgi:predicted DNA-binding protein
MEGKKKRIRISITIDREINNRLDEVSSNKSRLIEGLIISKLEKVGKDVSSLYL